MNIQSLSIVVPNKECINKCPFCVSRMINSNIYPNKMDVSDPNYDHHVEEYLDCMRFVADNGCKTIMLTGTSEPQQNKPFLNTFALLHRLIGRPFTNIEMQTTGMLLSDRNYLRFLRNFVGVKTIALSVNSYDNFVNCRTIGHGSSSKEKLPIVLEDLTKTLKEYDFNIRICYNLTDVIYQKLMCYESFEKLIDKSYIENLFKYTKEKLHADQVTLRKLYATTEKNEQNEWIEKHKISSAFTTALQDYLLDFEKIGCTAYGAPILDIEGMSVVYDLDCMGKKPEKDVLKYLILRPNCKLYSSWDSPASLVF